MYILYYYVDYTCLDCCYNFDSTEMCYCSECWDEEKHEYHNYKKDVIMVRNHAYCDCGREGRMKPETFCKKHNQLNIEVSPRAND